MVTIKYYRDPLVGECEICEYASVLEFLRRFENASELLDLRFFYDEILGSEIDQTDGKFLEINEDVIAVTHDSAIPRDPVTLWTMAIIFVVSAGVSYLLARQIPSVSSGESSSTSATNSLSSPTNEARVNKRIDDLFGYVAKHTPPLAQVPYRIGIDNQECEVLLLNAGRGRYQTWTDRFYDGDTQITKIPNACVNKYEPGTWPGNGSPSQTIGDVLTDQKIGVYYALNDLNSTELLPPNELDTSLGATWSIVSDGVTATLTATYLPDGFVIEDSFTVLSNLILKGFNYINQSTSKTVYDSIGDSYDFNTSTVAPVDIGADGAQEYEITNITETTIVINIPSDASVAIKAAWSAMSGGYTVPSKVYKLSGTGGTYYTTDVRADDRKYYNTWTPGTPGVASNPFTLTTYSYKPLAAMPYYDSVGPIDVSDYDEVMLNFVSSNGFYKLVDNKENRISASVYVLFEETDTNGDTTGNVTPYTITYSSNSKSTRKSVFQTERYTVPYDNCLVSCKRLTDRDKSSNVGNVDNIEWRDIYGFNTNPIDMNLGDITLFHVLIPSNSQSRLTKERKINMDIMRKITQYLGDGNFGPTESYATDNFAQIAIHLSLDPRIGRLSLSDINADGWLALSDEIIEYFGSDQMVRFGYDFDSSDTTYQDHLMTIANVVNCYPYTQNAVYDLQLEKKQNSSVMQVTIRNKKENTETREENYEQQYDGVELTYRDEEEGESTTIYIPEDRSATNPETISLDGCITYEQAYKVAWRKYYKQIHNYLTVKFDMDEFGRCIIPGRRIDSPDSTRFVRREGVEDGYRIFDGEVVDVSGLTVELSEPLVFTEGEDHYITFTKVNGDSMTPILCTQVDDYKVLLSVLPDESIYDGYERDRTKFVFASEQARQSIALIPQTVEFSLEDDGTETNSVTSINYTDKYYQKDLVVI